LIGGQSVCESTGFDAIKCDRVSKFWNLTRPPTATTTLGGSKPRAVTFTTGSDGAESGPVVGPLPPQDVTTSRIEQTAAFCRSTTTDDSSPRRSDYFEIQKRILTDAEMRRGIEYCPCTIELSLDSRYTLFDTFSTSPASRTSPVFLNVSRHDTARPHLDDAIREHRRVLAVVRDVDHRHIERAFQTQELGSQCCA
jgi:hypothetical protein